MQYASTLSVELLLLQAVFPEDPQEVVSLLGLPDYKGVVGSPGAILCNVRALTSGAQEPEVRDTFHIDNPDG